MQVSHALNTNSLPHLYPKDGKHFDAAITEFKQPSGAGHTLASRSDTIVGMIYVPHYIFRLLTCYPACTTARTYMCSAVACCRHTWTRLRAGNKSLPLCFCRATLDGDEPHPRVLLLLVKQGGNGLNLTEAQVRVVGSFTFCSFGQGLVPHFQHTSN